MRFGVFNWATLVPVALSLVSFVSVQSTEAATAHKKCATKKHCSMSKKCCPAKTKCMTHGKGKDIVQTACADGSFKTLVKDLKTANLVCVLEGKGPFTVFAPSDAAFGKQGEAKTSAEKEKLAKVLKYHVVAGKFTAADLASKRSIKTLEGEDLMLNSKDGKQLVDGALVTKADIECSNGVIHVIDTVLSPERGK